MDGFKIYELVLDCRKVRHKVAQKDLTEAAEIGKQQFIRSFMGKLW